MNALLKKVATVVLPDAWLSNLRHRFVWRWFRGRYASWADARANSAGYDDSAILARVLAATREVRSGRARWDRDGTTFRELWLNEPLLAVLRRIAAADGRLDVIDFGGGLDSTWWQHKDALVAVAPQLVWRVVEQPHVVLAAREFATERLNFYQSLGEAVYDGETSVILLSAVLPYLERPLELLAEIERLGFVHVIIDRTPFVSAGSTQLVVQHTPPLLGGGSYPAWLFERKELIAALGTTYELDEEWPGFDVVDDRVAYRGMYFRKRSPASDHG